MPLLQRTLLVLAIPLLSNCGAVLDSLVDGALDRESDKNDVRRHLRHGDSVREAQQGAFEDQFYSEMMWLQMN